MAKEYKIMITEKDRKVLVDALSIASVRVNEVNKKMKKVNKSRTERQKHFDDLFEFFVKMK
ncbi:MAG: hypothetical protein IKS59_03800 [Aeriscardovia sp.]|nr:hypothetical protein [Aeriscardovia sp.]